MHVPPMGHFIYRFNHDFGDFVLDQSFVSTCLVTTARLYTLAVCLSLVLKLV